MANSKLPFYETTLIADLF